MFCFAKINTSDCMHSGVRCFFLLREGSSDFSVRQGIELEENSAAIFSVANFPICDAFDFQN